MLRNERESGPSIVVLLLSLSLIPLIGATWFAASEVGDATLSLRVTAEVEAKTMELLLVTEIESAILDETYWMLARKGLDDLGLSFDVARELSGFDIEGESIAASEHVDSLAAELDDPTLFAALDEARSSIDSLESDAFQVPRAIINRISNDMSDDLYRAAGDVSNGAELLARMRVFESAATAREAYSNQLWGYFATEYFPVAGGAPDYVGLIEVRRIHIAAIDAVEAHADADSEVRASIATLLTSPDRATFDNAAQDLTERALTALATGSDVTPAPVDAEVIQAVFGAGRRASTEHVQLLEAAGLDVVASSQQLSDAASGERRNLISIGIAIAMSSFAIALVIAGYIARPMRLLAAFAKHLGSGHIEDRLALTGPSEVRLASSALNAAGESLQLVERLEHDATHDDLTQAGNRKASLLHLNQSMSRAQRTGEPGALIFIDIDHFKTVNDTHGHAAGDAVLLTVAQRLQDLVRGGDHVGRFGGDEFVVIADKVEGEMGALNLAQRILATISTPIPANDTASQTDTLHVTASVGIAVFGGEERTLETLLHAADQAAYASKQRGRNRATFETPEITAASRTSQDDVTHA